MPHAEEFKHIQVTPLHPTFGAEVSGVDFSQQVPEEVFQELRAAATTVSMNNASHRVISLAPCYRLIGFKPDVLNPAPFHFLSLSSS
jgi:hypothetical protein